MLPFSFPRNFRAERQIRYARKTKMHDIIFFSFLSISDFLCRFASWKSLKIFTVGKTLQFSADHHAGWPLCKLWEHRFLVPDLVSSPPPPPTVLQRLSFLYRSLRFSDRNSIIDCNFDNTWRVFGVRLIDKVARTLFHSLLLFLLR